MYLLVDRGHGYLILNPKTEPKKSKLKSDQNLQKLDTVPIFLNWKIKTESNQKPNKYLNIQNINYFKLK